MDKIGEILVKLASVNGEYEFKKDERDEFLAFLRKNMLYGNLVQISYPVSKFIYLDMTVSMNKNCTRVKVLNHLFRVRMGFIELPFKRYDDAVRSIDTVRQEFYRIGV